MEDGCLWTDTSASSLQPPNKPLVPKSLSQGWWWYMVIQYTHIWNENFNNSYPNTSNALRYFLSMWFCWTWFTKLKWWRTRGSRSAVWKSPAQRAGIFGELGLDHKGKLMAELFLRRYGEQLRSAGGFLRACGSPHSIRFQTDTSYQGAMSLASADHSGTKPNRNNVPPFLWIVLRVTSEKTRAGSAGGESN